MSSIVLGLGGLKESGKDTVADMLVANHGFVKIGMSDPLHEAMLRLNPIVLEAVGPDEDPTRYEDIVAERGYTAAKEVPEVRRLLQVFGTEIVRDMIGKDFWVDMMARRVSELIESGQDRIAVTGIRFPNELEYFKAEGNTGVLSELWISRAAVAQLGDTHESENSITAADFGLWLWNNGSLDELSVEVDTLVAYLESKEES